MVTGAARADKTPSLWTYHTIRPTKNVATHKKGFQDLHFYTIIIGRGSQSLSGARGHEGGNGGASPSPPPPPRSHVPSPVLMYFSCPHLDLSLMAKVCDLFVRETAKPPPPPRPGMPQRTPIFAHHGDHLRSVTRITTPIYTTPPTRPTNTANTQLFTYIHPASVHQPFLYTLTKPLTLPYTLSTLPTLILCLHPACRDHHTLCHTPQHPTSI